MNLRPMLIANGALIAVMAGVSLWAWDAIPDGANVPVHWNLSGEPDRFGSKLEALVGLPALSIALTLLFYVLPHLDPRRANIAASVKFWTAASVGAVLIVAYVHVLMVLTATGVSIDMSSAAVPAICVFLILLGNYLSKTRSNWFAGVRTPWTLSSDYSWEKTHRWTGRLFVASGLAGLAAWFVVDAHTAMVVALVALLLSVIAAVVMSYVFWKNDPDRAGGAKV